jgi:hypothetical protein
MTTMLKLHVGAFFANAPSLKLCFKHSLQDKMSSFSRSKPLHESKGRKRRSLRLERRKLNTNIVSNFTSLFSTTSGSSVRYGFEAGSAYE